MGNFLTNSGFSCAAIDWEHDILHPPNVLSRSDNSSMRPGPQGQCDTPETASACCLIVI